MSSSPRFTVLTSPMRCSETGYTIYPGTLCLYIPAHVFRRRWMKAKVYTVESKRAREFEKELKSKEA